MRKSSTNERIGKKIKKLRMEKKLTQAQLSDELSIHQKHLSNIENGRKAITIALLDKLCLFFNKPQIFFFDFIEQEINEQDAKLVNSAMYLMQTADSDTKKKILQIINILTKKDKK